MQPTVVEFSRLNLKFSSRHEPYPSGSSLHATHLPQHKSVMENQCVSRRGHLLAASFWLKQLYPGSLLMSRIRSLADASVMSAPTAPHVMVQGPWAFRNSQRSINTKFIDPNVAHSNSESAYGRVHELPIFSLSTFQHNLIHHL